MRAHRGGRERLVALELLADAPTVRILTALATEPRPPQAMRVELDGCATAAALMGRLRPLLRLRVVARCPSDDGAGVLYALTPSGEGVVSVGEVLDAWTLGGIQPPRAENAAALARMRTAALVEGWRAAVVPTLATEPLTCDELGERAGLSPRQATTWMERLVRSGLLAQAPGSAPASYALTQRARATAQVVLAAIFWQRRYLPSIVAPGPCRVTEALAVALYGLRLRRVPDGVCSLTVEDDRGGPGPAAGLCVTVAGGTVVGVVPIPGAPPDAWCRGPIAAWERALDGGPRRSIGVGGQDALAAGLLAGLIAAIRGEPTRGR